MLQLPSPSVSKRVSRHVAFAVRCDESAWLQSGNTPYRRVADETLRANSSLRTRAVGARCVTPSSQQSAKWKVTQQLLPGASQPLVERVRHR